MGQVVKCFVVVGFIVVGGYEDEFVQGCCYWIGVVILILYWRIKSMSNWLVDKLIFFIMCFEFQKSLVLEGLWYKCLFCEVVLYCLELEKILDVCLKCDYYMCINVCICLDIFFDEDGCEELGVDFELVDCLKFCDSKKYKDCFVVVQKDIGEKDVLIVMSGKLQGMLVVVCVFEFFFMGGLMGVIVGECFVCVVNVVLEKCCLLICFFVFGGVCMQEVLILLMQMVKILVVLVCLCEEGILFVLVLIDLVYGGVFVSLVMFGDVIVGEFKVLIGFVGFCVIEQIVCEKLLEGFQCSEFFFEYGVIDMIVYCVELWLCLVNLLLVFIYLLSFVFV